MAEDLLDVRFASRYILHITRVAQLLKSQRETSHQAAAASAPAEGGSAGQPLFFTDSTGDEHVRQALSDDSSDDDNDEVTTLNSGCVCRSYLDVSGACRPAATTRRQGPEVRA